MAFTTLDPTDLVVSSDSVTAPAWSSNQPTLTQFFTASAVATTTISAGAFYLDVYQTASTAVGAAVQFSVAYGNATGLGSPYFNGLVAGVTPSLTTYKQYKTLVYGPALTGNQGFNFGGQATSSSDIWVINVDRNRYKESLFPGTFNLTLSGSGGSIKLTDNSNDSGVVNYLDCGRVFNIVSGSNGSAVSITPTNGIANGQTASGSYGLYLPDIATIILNPRALSLASAYGGIGLIPNTSTNPTSATSSYVSTNSTILYQALSQSGNFQLNSQETISSNYVFIRIKNADYNYTANPTFVSGSGNLVYPSLVNNPQTYITTVGMYNANSELLAVAKLSRPLVKDFTKEALLRVKLDW